jgi:peptidyl-prolyl cis-trans isomerase C
MPRLLLPVLVGLVCGTLGSACHRPPPPAPTTARPDPGDILAEMDGAVITIQDLEQNIAKQPVAARPQYQSAAGRKGLLEHLIRFEIFASEAKKQGLDKDPEVIQATKQQMVTQLVQRQLSSTNENITEADAKAYYDQHPSEFIHADQIRVSEIVTADKALATKLARDAVHDDEERFGERARRYTEDPAARNREGDLGPLDPSSTTVPKPILEAALALKDVGAIAGPLEIEGRYHVLRLTRRVPGMNRTLPEARREIQSRLTNIRRAKRMDDWLAGLRTAHKVQVHEENLSPVAK